MGHPLLPALVGSLANERQLTVGRHVGVAGQKIWCSKKGSRKHRMFLKDSCRTSTLLKPSQIKTQTCTWWKVTLFKVKWPPTIGYKKATNWITWYMNRHWRYNSDKFQHPQNNFKNLPVVFAYCSFSVQPNYCTFTKSYKNTTSGTREPFRNKWRLVACPNGWFRFFEAHNLHRTKTRMRSSCRGDFVFFGKHTMGSPMTQTVSQLQIMQPNMLFNVHLQ